MQVSTETLSLGYRSAAGARAARGTALRAMAAALARERRPLTAWAACARMGREARLRSKHEAADRQQRLRNKQRNLSMYVSTRRRRFVLYIYVLIFVSESQKERIDFCYLRFVKCAVCKTKHQISLLP